MERKKLIYNNGHDLIEEELVMSKRKVQLSKDEEPFGERLERLRKASGYSLRELASEIGISHRMVVYYEKHAEHPPTHLMPQLAKALNVTTDQLLGVEKVKAVKRKTGPDGKLRKVFEEASSLPRRQQEKITEFVSAFINQYKLNRSR